MHSPSRAKVIKQSQCNPFLACSSFSLSAFPLCLPPSLPPPGTTTYPGLSLLLPVNTFSPASHSSGYKYSSSCSCFFQTFNTSTPTNSRPHFCQCLQPKLLQGTAASKYARNVKIKNTLLKLSQGTRCACSWGSDFPCCILEVDFKKGKKPATQQVVVPLWKFSVHELHH